MVEGGQAAADPDAKVETLRVEKHDVPQSKAPEEVEQELEYWVIEENEVEELARRLALLPASQRPKWWDAVCFETPLTEERVTLVRISVDEEGRIRREDLFEKLITKQINWDDSVNVDDLAILDQRLGVLDNSQEYARREE